MQLGSAELRLVQRPQQTQSRGGIVAYDGDLVGGVLGGGWHGASVEESHELWQASRHIVRLIAIPSRHPYSQELLAHVGRS